MGNLSRFMPAPRSRFSVFVLLLLAIIAGSSRSPAQSEIKISGQVLDQDSGSPIQGALISLEETGKVAVSDQSGHFLFCDIPSGKYILKATRIGYAESFPLLAEVNDYSPAKISIYLPQEPLKVADQVVISGIAEFRIQKNGNRTTVDLPLGSSIELTEVIKRLPELEIISSGSAKYLRIRGSQLNSVEILLDGRSQNSVLNSKGDISAIPMSSIKRIEITEGGSLETDGLAGSVNFITKSASTDNVLNSAAGRGSFGWESYSASFSHAVVSSLRTGIYAASTSFNGDYEFVDPRDSIEIRQNNHLRDINLLGKIDFAYGQSTVELNGRYFRRKSGIPGPVFQTTPLAKASSLEKEFYTRFQAGLGELANISILGGMTSRIGDYDSPITPTSYIPYKARYREWVRDIKVGLQSRRWLDINSIFSLRYDVLDGTDYIRPESSFGRHSRLVNSAGLGLRFRLPDFPMSELTSLNMGLRRDGGKGGEFWAPSAILRANLNLPLSPGLDISAFRARRLPNLADLFWKEDVFASPNPNLVSERSRGYEAGIDFHLNNSGRSDLRITRFETSYDDLIIWRRWGGDKFKPLNLSRAYIGGWEISISSRPANGPLAVFWNGSFINPLNRESGTLYDGKFLTYRPIGTQNAGIEYTGYGIKAGISAKHIGRRYTTEENTKSLAPVDLVDLNIGYDLTYKHLGVRVSLDILNVGDIQYENLERQPERPREYRLKLKLCGSEKI